MSLPPTWADEQCNRRKKVSIPAVFHTDLEIIEDEDDEAGDGSVWTLQHQGCGQQGMVITATNNFFSPSNNIMEHHRKGKSNIEKS